jgi:hypothetical protein
MVGACSHRAMEQLDDESQIFASLPAYRLSPNIINGIREIMNSINFRIAIDGQEVMK